MKRLMANRKQKKAILIALAAPLMFSPAPLMAATGTSEPVVAIAQQAQTIVSVQRINPTTVDVVFSNNQRMTFDFYGDNIFRMFQDTNGGILRDPEAKPEARILVDNPRRPVSQLDIQDENGQVTITTGKVKLQLDKSTALLKVTNLATNTVAFEETLIQLFQLAIYCRFISIIYFISFFYHAWKILMNIFMAAAYRTVASPIKGKP